VERVDVANRTARQNAIAAGLLRERRKIREEIEARRKRWGKRPVRAGAPPLEEPPRRRIAPKSIQDKDMSRSGDRRQRCRPEVFNPRLVHWAYIKDDVLRIEQAQFGARALSEEQFTRYLANPDGTHVLLWDTSSGRVVGYTLCLPAEQVYHAEYYPERLAEISALDAPTAYIVDTAIDPAYTGQHLVGTLLITLEEALVKKGYRYLDRDVAVAHHYAANTVKVYAHRIIASYLHESPIGPQMFFRIRLTRSSGKRRSKDIQR
jgi:ribosomal protein S18 acetylase RimI-like enzyme